MIDVAPTVADGGSDDPATCVVDGWTVTMDVDGARLETGADKVGAAPFAEVRMAVGISQNDIEHAG